VSQRCSAGALRAEKSLAASVTSSDWRPARSDAYTALKLVCWLNTLELERFSAPFEVR
jgi:hypothetical protein